MPFPISQALAAGTLDPALSESENLANCRGISGYTSIVNVGWELILDQEVGVLDGLPLVTAHVEADRVDIARTAPGRLRVRCCNLGESAARLKASFALLPLQAPGSGAG